MEYAIIVAKFNECINWTTRLSNVIVYNKGDPTENAIPIKNVGREGHTYYTYISQNYDNIPDLVFFLQGNPFDHTDSCVDKIQSLLHIHKHGKPDESLANMCEIEESFPRFYHLTEIPDFLFLTNTVEHTTMGEQRHSHWQCEGLYNTYESIFSEKCDESQECVFGHGGQFMVSKHAILKRPKSFYENIVNILSHSSDPKEGYDVERFHKYIFDC
jgi:hypothetical protein